MRYAIRQDRKVRKPLPGCQLTETEWLACWDTEYPECIDPLSVQEAMLSGGNKITFKGTEKEYEAVKKKLAAKVKVTIIKEQKTKKEK